MIDMLYRLGTEADGMPMHAEPDSGGRRRLVPLIEEGIALARSGDAAGARLVFRQIIQNTPDDEDAWLWLSWVADSPQESSRYLREARVFLPDSLRLSEAERWATGEADGATDTEAASPRPTKGPRRLQLGAGGLFPWAEQVRKTAQDGAAAAEQKLRSLPQRWHAPRVSGMLPNLSSPLMTGAAIAVIVLFAMLGIANARSQQRVVQALDLPTPVIDPTFTPTVRDLTESDWLKASVASSREDWAGAITALVAVREVDPRNKDARVLLAEAHFHEGMRLIAQNELEAAKSELDRAVRLNASSEFLQDARCQLTLYMAGVDAFRQQQWQMAVDEFGRVYALNSNFRDTREMLGRAYYHAGIERMDAEVWDEARDHFQEATELVPDLEDAKARLAQVLDILIPPSRIEVDLSDKACTVYEGHRVIHVFRICTGRPSAPTLPGRYQVLDKLPMAYASKWDLDMPWWLGIYWAGGSENGFHALPILSNGTTLWSGSLGTGCSFGCIVLDTRDAITLYNWAEVGTVVLVTY